MNRILLSIALLLSAGTLFAGTIGTSPTTPKEPTTSPYANKKPIEFMKDFLDVTKEPNKPFKYWVTGLLYIIKGKKQFDQFAKEFMSGARMRNDNRICLTFIKYKDKFGKDVVALIKKIGFEKVRKAVAIRVKKK